VINVQNYPSVFEHKKVSPMEKRPVKPFFMPKYGEVHFKKMPYFNKIKAFPNTCLERLLII
jgi:hypothetical protein